MSDSRRSFFNWAHGGVKFVACCVGLVITVVALMSVIGLWTDNLWIRGAGALVVALAIPLFIADRLLPKDDKKPAQGIVTDVLSVLWMGAATTTVALGSTSMHDTLAAEAQRYADSGWSRSAQATRWLAAKEERAELPDEPEPEPEPASDPEPQEPPVLDEATVPPLDPPLPPPVSASEAKRERLTPSALFERWAPSVVTIQTKDGPFGTGAGTGFIVKTDGTIATNHHVIDGADEVEVKLFNGETVKKVELLTEDAAVDLALLRIETDVELGAVDLGNSAGVTVGEPVIVIGNPLGLEHTLTDGLLSSRRVLRGKKFIQMSAPVSPGNSGGPVFDGYGDVIGVTVAKFGFGRGENLNLAVPIDQLKVMLAADHPGRHKFGNTTW